MRQNIDQVLSRGEKLEDLAAKSQMLEADSHQFAKKASKSKSGGGILSEIGGFFFGPRAAKAPPPPPPSASASVGVASSSSMSASSSSSSSSAAMHVRPVAMQPSPAPVLPIPSPPLAPLAAPHQQPQLPASSQPLADMLLKLQENLKQSGGTQPPDILRVQQEIEKLQQQHAAPTDNRAGL